MPSIVDVYTTMKGVLAGAGLSLPIRWRGDDKDSTGTAALPDTPAPFLYCNLQTDPGDIAGFGGGRGANLYRTSAQLYIYTFVPRGDGSEPLALEYGETVAVLYRSYRDAVVSVFAASVIAGGAGGELAPPGLSSAVNAYSYALVEILFSYDQIG